MSTDQQAKPVEVARPAPPNRILWHAAASVADLVAAFRGDPYTAKCGKRCQGAPGVMRLRSELAAIEKCVVCADLYGVEL